MAQAVVKAVDGLRIDCVWITRWDWDQDMAVVLRMPLLKPYYRKQIRVCPVVVPGLVVAGNANLSPVNG